MSWAVSAFSWTSIAKTWVSQHTCVFDSKWTFQQVRFRARLSWPHYPPPPPPTPLSLNPQWGIGYGVRLRIKRSSVRIRPWPLRWVLGQSSLLPLSQGEAFTLASITKQPQQFRIALEQLWHKYKHNPTTDIPLPFWIYQQHAEIPQIRAFQFCWEILYILKYK